MTGFRGSECPLGAPPPCRSGMGTSGGTLGRAKALPKLQAGVGAPARSLPGLSLLFPAPPVPWASCPSRGAPTPRSCLTAGKGFETTVMARGKALLGWGHPKRGVQGHSSPPGQGSMDTARLRTPGKGEDLGLIPVTYPQIPALEGPWGARAGLGLSRGRGWPGGNSGREGNARKDGTCAGNSRAGKSRGRRGRGRCELAACVHPEVALSE